MPQSGLVRRLSGPILLGLALARGRCGVLDLDPVICSPRDVARAKPLADNALATQLADVLEHFQTVPVQVLAQLQSGAGIVDETDELALAHLDRHWP